MWIYLLSTYLLHENNPLRDVFTFEQNHTSNYFYIDAAQKFAFHNIAKEISQNANYFERFLHENQSFDVYHMCSLQIFQGSA